MAAWPAACSVQAREGPRGVILVCIDTLRADHLGCYGYAARETSPALDRLASGALIFADASACAGWTKPSVPSFLTGTYPCEHGVYEGSADLEQGAVTDVLPDSAETLAEVFEDAGWSTAAFVHNAQLRPGNGFEQGFERYQDEVGDARAIRTRAEEWLRGLDGNEPFFLYLHLLDVHWPYPVPEEYATRFAGAEAIAPFRADDARALIDAVNHGERELSPAEREALIALYDGAVRYADDELGRLFAWLDERGLGQDVVVCVLADHGEEFGEHGRIGHGHGLSEGLLRVPWILRAPGVPAGRVDTPVSLVDLFPTLLAAAGLEAPPSSGLDRLREAHLARPVFAEHKAPDRYEHSLRAGADKLVRKATAPPPAVEPDAIPVRLGQRCEAEVEHDGGILAALQLKPREEEPDDPPELKAVIERVDGDRFELAGVPVRLAPDAERQLAEGAESDALAEGALVKARGEFVDGVLVADRLKFYGPEVERVFEVRGTVTAVAGGRGAGSVHLGPLEIAITRATDFKDFPEPKARMEREDVVRLLAGGAAALEETGYRFELSGFSVNGGIETPAASLPEGLEAALEARARELVARRIFSADDRLVLDAETIERLRDLGYVK